MRINPQAFMLRQLKKEWTEMSVKFDVYTEKGIAHTRIEEKPTFEKWLETLSIIEDE